LPDLEYLKYQFQIFQNLCSDVGISASDKNDKKRNKIYKGFKFRTRALELFNHHYDEWYYNKIKKIPTNLKLTPITLAHWFCDDGCIQLKKR